MIDKKKDIIQHLNISDIFVFLSIDVEKEKFYDFFEKDKDIKLVGAFLIDLANIGKIQIIKNKVYVKDPNPIGDQTLDIAFSLIKSFKKPQSARKIFPYFFPYFSTKGLIQELFELLLDKLEIYGVMEYQKVIEYHNRRRFSKSLIPKNINIDIKTHILNELLNILLTDKEPDMKYYYLICLLSVDEMYKVLGKNIDNKKIKERINILSSNEIISKIIDREIYRGHANVQVVC